MKKFSKIVVRNPENHNPDYLIIEGTFVKENGENAQLTYYEKIGAPELWGNEYYSGENYIVGSKENSYSRNYVRGNGLPKKFKEMAEELKTIVTHL